MFLTFYDRVIKCHDTRNDMSEIISMSWHSNDNIPGNVFNVHTDMSIDTKLFTFKICTYDIQNFFWHVPYCARSACISSPLIEFPLIDFSQQDLVLEFYPQVPSYYRKPSIQVRYNYFLFYNRHLNAPPNYSISANFFCCAILHISCRTLTSDAEVSQVCYL